MSKRKGKKRRQVSRIMDFAKAERIRALANVPSEASSSDPKWQRRAEKAKRALAKNAALLTEPKRYAPRRASDWRMGRSPGRKG
jgi:hypothetical protein